DFNPDNLVVYGLVDNDSENVSISLKDELEEKLCEDAPSPTILAKISNQNTFNKE
ncbi:hypothetical protein KI387_008249, partial [Taxus chinensis]